MKLDVLVIGAHPDDAEISAGGTILKLIDANKRVGIVDITRGEMGSRGSQSERDAETSAANAVMGIDVRVNLDLPDGRVVASTEARERLAGLIRKHGPDLVIAHSEKDLHPDHVASGRLAREAWYLSGLKRLATQDAPARRPRRLMNFLSHTPFEPTFVVDITPVWERKVELIRCYMSQLEPDGPGDKGEHFLFGADILHRVETKARTFGESIGVAYGEPFLVHGAIGVEDVNRLL